MMDIDTNMMTSGELITSWLEGKYKDVLKTFYNLTLRTEHCDASSYIAVSYRMEYDVDGSPGGWISLGTVTTNSFNTLTFDELTYNVDSKRIQLKFAFTGANATTSPFLLGYELRCMARPFDLEEGRITLNENMDFRTFGGLDTSGYHNEFRDVTKDYYALSVISSGLDETSTSKYITVEYKSDREKAYHTLLERVTTSPYQTLYLPKLKGKFVRFKFTLNSPSDTYMIAYILDGTLRHVKKKELEFVVHVANGLPLPHGGEYLCDVFSYMRDIRALDREEWPVTIELFDEQKFNVVIKSMEERRVYNPSRGQWEFVVHINAIEAGIEIPEEGINE